MLVWILEHKVELLIITAMAGVIFQLFISVAAAVWVSSKWRKKENE